MLSPDCSRARQPLDICYLAAGYLLPAGIEAYLLHYATEMRQRGLSVRIIVFQPLPRVPHRFLLALRERDIPIESLYAHVTIHAWIRTILAWLPWLAWRFLHRSGVGKVRDLWQHQRKKLAVQRLGRILSRERPDVVHVKGRIVTEALTVLPAERTVYQHALMGTIDPSWEPQEVSLFRTFLDRIAAVLVQSEGIASTFKESFGIQKMPSVAFTMAPDELAAVDRDALVDPATSPMGGAGQPRFGILCRFTAQKGIAYILDALVMLREQGMEPEFTFAGQGPLEVKIRQFVSERGLTHVRVKPVTSAVSAFADMDIFVHPGLDDAMPVSIVEALMFGKPCIGSRVGGTPELVRDGVDGLIVDPASSEQLMQAMRRFIEMPADELLLFARNARLRYETSCTPEVVGTVVQAVYERIAGSDLQGAICDG